MKATPLLMEDFKFWPILGSHGHWAARVLKRATPTVILGIPRLWSSPRTHDAYICCRAFGSEAVNKCFNDLGLSRLGFKHPTFCMRGVRSNQLRLRGGQSTSIKGKRGNQHEYRGYIYVFNWIWLYRYAYEQNVTKKDISHLYLSWNYSSVFSDELAFY